MDEIAKVSLGNEMDLILAHKHSMRLAEAMGLSLAAQTTFATAVSEIARNTIENGKSGCLILSIEISQREHFLVACLTNAYEGNHYKSGLEYAKRLVDKFRISQNGSETSIEIFYRISPVAKPDDRQLDAWRNLFRNEPPLSPYEELKRKNEQLQELSEKVHKSEKRYKTLTDSLPLIIFSLDPDGNLIYANNWLSSYTGKSVQDLNNDRWKSVVHPDDYASLSYIFTNKNAKRTSANFQLRIKRKELNEYFWHQVSVTPFTGDDDQLQFLIGYVADIHAQKLVEETLKDNRELKAAQKTLEEQHLKLEAFNQELERSNLELQQFAFVASHDLQEPVRKILFYSDYLLNKYSNNFDEKSLYYLKNMQSASQRMRMLIQGLLSFSQIGKEEKAFRKIDLNKVAADVLQNLELVIGEKKAKVRISPLPTVFGDERMMRQLFENLISNSLKYCKADIAPDIVIDSTNSGEEVEISFQDNGIGFDEKYLPQMFTLFQRLHGRETYDGTGLGLAICRKITELHGGKIWARALENKGSTFFISLPLTHQSKITTDA